MLVHVYVMLQILYFYMEEESILKICCLYDKLDNNSNIDDCIYFGKTNFKGGGGKEIKDNFGVFFFLGFCCMHLKDLLLLSHLPV